MKTKTSKLCVLAIFMAVVNFSFIDAKAQIFKEKDKVLNIGLGFGGSYYSRSYYSMTFPLISASLEYCVKDGVGPGAIGIGGYLGFTGSRNNNYNGYYNNYVNTAFGFRGAYHLTDLGENFDLYGGLGVGFVVVSHYGNYYNGNYEHGSYSDWSAFIGARYYIKRNIALMAELGGGFYNLNLGIAIKLK